MTRLPLLGLTLAFLLPSCTQPVRVIASKPVIVTRYAKPAVAPQFTAACAKPTPQDQALRTNGSLLAAWLHDSTALTACGAQVDAIRALQHE